MSSGEQAAGHPLFGLWQLHPFRVHIGVLFTLMVMLVGAALAWSNYTQSRRTVLSATQDVFQRIGNEVQNEMLKQSLPAEATVDWASRSLLTEGGNYSERLMLLPALTDSLNRNPMLDSIYAGYYNGDFFQVHALHNDQDRERFQAPRHAAFRLQSIERDRKRMQVRLLDAALNEISSSEPAVPDELFDPRTRPWYNDALRDTEIIHTAPYVFFTTREVGQTIARRAEHGRAIVGADLTLSMLSQMLDKVRPNPSSQLALYDDDLRLIAHTGERLPVSLDGRGNPVMHRLEELSPVMAQALAELKPGAPATMLQVEGRDWLARLLPAGQTTHGKTYLAIATPRDELLVDAQQALQHNLWLALLLVALTTPLSWWVAHRIASEMNALTRQAAAIRRFDFSTPAPMDTRIVEVRDLGMAMGRMRETIRKFVEITTALSAERRLDRLLRRVLDEAREAAGAAGGVIYLLDEDAGMLTPADQHWENKSREAPEPLSLQDETSPVVRAAREAGKPQVHVLGSAQDAGLDFAAGHFPQADVRLVTAPLLNRSGRVIGVMCLFQSAADPEPSRERLALVEAFAGAGAVAIDNQQLLAGQKKLLTALIDLMASAIDSKSPYTGGHCQRVPELTHMLTRAACDAKTGPFADFNLDDDQWEALTIAGGLHDCGKVTTPEYVMDKATKLETLYDRIHEVRMRFEVLKRDAEIACLRAIAAGGDEAALRDTLAAEHRALDEDFAFVAVCNQGDEFLSPDKQQRLRSIAARTWQRTLDDRLGLSWDEARRKARTPAAPLPVTEPLLADKPEHVIERQRNDIIAPDNPWGFKLDTPKALYNRGELHNLSVSRGTLSDEERYKINDHMVQTIVMLNALPFPPHLRSVPEYAGAHHEQMTGGGYPRRLTREQMSVPARIMAIADIFEALTADDRPYKKAKKLSEAVKIMQFMKKDQHIDPDLFDLFINSGVYLDYARRFMKPENIDIEATRDLLGLQSGQQAAAA